MADDLPSSDKAVYIFLGMIALGFALVTASTIATILFSQFLRTGHLRPLPSALQRQRSLSPSSCGTIPLQSWKAFHFRGAS